MHDGHLLLLLLQCTMNTRSCAATVMHDVVFKCLNFKVGHNHIYIYILFMVYTYTVHFEGELPSIRSYTDYMYSSGQLY
jgi:hypothetical protein